MEKVKNLFTPIKILLHVGTSNPKLYSRISCLRSRLVLSMTSGAFFITSFPAGMKSFPGEKEVLWCVWWKWGGELITPSPPPTPAVVPPAAGGGAKPSVKTEVWGTMLE